MVSKKRKPKPPTHPRNRFHMRLGQSARDQRLAAQMEADRGRGVNLSDLVKELLIAYYRGDLDRFNRPGQPSASDEIARRMAEAKQRLLGVTFNSLNEQ